MKKDNILTFADVCEWIIGFDLADIVILGVYVKIIFRFCLFLFINCVYVYVYVYEKYKGTKEEGREEEEQKRRKVGNRKGRRDTKRSEGTRRRE